MKNRFFITGLFLWALYLFVPHVSYASTIFVETEPLVYKIGDIVRFDIYLNTEGSFINTIDTEVSFDSKDLKFFDFGDSDSVINFWVEKKSVSNVINLSGIVPGGFAGEKGKIMSLYFETLKKGQTNITVQNSTLFLNDGEGTEEKILSTSSSIETSNEVSQNKGILKDYSQDFYPPESFSPEISRSASLYDNQWFLVFSTQDKDSGMSHYLIKEARYKPFLFFKKWAKSASPYVLKDQSKSSFIAIKAVDKAGNEMTERLYPENLRPLIEQILVGILFAGIVLLCIFVLYKLVKKISSINNEE